jgi:hypothetical protein
VTRAIDPALRRAYDLRGVVGQLLDEGAPLAGKMERPHARRQDGAATRSPARWSGHIFFGNRWHHADAP